jgi:hypothetical protein
MIKLYKKIKNNNNEYPTNQNNIMSSCWSLYIYVKYSFTSCRLQQFTKNACFSYLNVETVKVVIFPLDISTYISRRRSVSYKIQCYNTIVAHIGHIITYNLEAKENNKILLIRDGSRRAETVVIYYFYNNIMTIWFCVVWTVQ